MNKEIEEMINIVQRHMETLCETPCDEAVFRDMMSTLVEAGYRKADEVRKEIAKEIAEWLYDHDYRAAPDVIVKKYGVEVNK